MNFMGLTISRARQAAVRTEPPVTAAEGSAQSTGTRLLDSGWVSASPQNRALPRVTDKVAERHATVFACCNVIAGDTSKVPLEVRQKNADGSDTAVTQHPAAYLLNTEAAPGVPAVVARYALAYAFTLRGTGYAWCPRSAAGELEMIDLVLPDRCATFRNGRARFYDFEDGEGVRRRVAARSMAHLRYMAQDGWTGRSPLQVAGDSVGLALADQNAAARIASGVPIKAYIQLDDYYESDEDRRMVAQRIKNALRDPDNDLLPVLGPQDNVKKLDLSAADQELLSSRKFDREQLAAIYRVPPSKLQMLEYGVKANGQQQAIDYKTDCLLHWGGFMEQQLGQTVLTEAERRAGLFLRHDYSALMQPTTKELHDALTKAVGGPIMTANTAQKLARLPVTKGSDDDKLHPPSNMTRESGKASGDKEDDE